MEKSNITERERKIIDYLGENCVSCKWDGDSWELQYYTDAGGDMNWTLDALTKECLQDYIDNFDINEEVLLWWQPGDPWSGRRPGDGVPFDNVKQHYEDLEDWLDSLQEICDGMPE